MSSVYGRQFVDVGENLDDSLAFVRLLILSNPTCTQNAYASVYSVHIRFVLEQFLSVNVVLI